MRFACTELKRLSLVLCKMQIRVLQTVWREGMEPIEPGVGNFAPALAQQLIDAGVAELYETKVITELETKKKRSTSSRRGRPSRKRTAKSSGRKKS